MIAVEVAKFLHARGIAHFDETGTAGNVFIGIVPDTPDECLTVTASGGRPNDGTPNVVHGVQIRTRSGLDPRRAYEMALEAYDALTNFHGTTLTGGGEHVVLIQDRSGSPTSIGQDENGRHEYTIDLDVMCSHTFDS